MPLIDTHAHLYLDDFAHDIDDVLSRARDVGVETVLLPNIDATTIDALHALTERFPDRLHPMMGLHPGSVADDVDAQLAAIERALDQKTYVAVGEIGLDHYWSTDHVDAQARAFGCQLDWAKDRGLPVAIHCRDAFDDVIDQVAAHQDGRLTGVLHCFTGTGDQARRLIDLGLHLGIGGVVTFKNSGASVRDALTGVPLETLVLETDSPYLAPAPHRGKRNEPALLPRMVDVLSDLYQLDAATIERTTTSNARRLFNLPA